ncbi:hypothetical protein G7084_05295 [Weissella coleopterorum]|uniref:Uncharacterized protein n=1 Tax=Weissella coleopterorum TaxID=2714949 RepID=A0A6G8B0L1_9LACO|nr:hypothetical protein [Weissella coleopterorum]QIL50777.1 hypothetical protein G7084_05295 [Weissella coleopterorum]
MLERPVLRYQEYLPNYEKAVQQLIQQKRAQGYINLAPANSITATPANLSKQEPERPAQVVIDTNELLVKNRGLGLSLNDIISEEQSVAQQVNLNYFKEK